ncbi:MAG TPA: crosslink repair DNA glycosylase YcaQ family protein, partial [Symbiobacteriaceae bacterium]|nr:crosslink repair DNA glycosylase YcaQ family protein [Symbiobacteriaceae bacterium]
WRLITGEVIPVNLERRPAWVLAADLPRLADPAPARGVRFLPPHDPYLQMRDRATLVADRAVQRRLWRAAGSPGAVLADGELVATWRAEKHGKRLCLTVESFAASLPDLEAEAQALLPFRGCTELDLNVNGAGS